MDILAAQNVYLTFSFRIVLILGETQATFKYFRKYFFAVKLQV
jgi:hypothetical protein